MIAGPACAKPAARARDLLDLPRPPVVLAYGIGVDSTAMLIELVARGETPDLVLTADTGSEKPATYAYLDIIRRWMEGHGIEFQICRYQPQRFKHWPPYATLIENVLTNATLPSISLGRHSCSLKWKIAPQDKFIAAWRPAIDAWDRGQKVVRLIGYDASPADTRRHGLSALWGHRYTVVGRTVPDLLFPELFDPKLPPDPRKIIGCHGIRVIGVICCPVFNEFEPFSDLLAPARGVC